MGRMFDALRKVEQEKNHELKEDSSPVPESIVLDSKLISYFAPSSLAAEQFRRLRNEIIRPWLGKSPKTILVTSAMAGEGKSLVAVNLAIAIAVELHSHALIVDCDLRNSSLARYFGFVEAKGLSDYLTGEVPLQDLLIKTSVDKLSILPGGTFHDNPVELIGSNKMKSLVANLKERYADRFIILDSPPLLATTEPSVLNDIVDCILFVIKAGDTPRESIQQALKLLDKAKIMGVVLNDIEFKTEAMVRRYFGTNLEGYGYYNPKFQMAPENSTAFTNRTKEVKMLFTKLITKKEAEL